MFFLLLKSSPVLSIFFFFNDTATTEIYTLSLHDALPIFGEGNGNPLQCPCLENPRDRVAWWAAVRSEEHTSELQSPKDLVCRLLLEKKKGDKVVEYISVARVRRRTSKGITEIG